MRRKILKQGLSSFGISLPADWIKNHSLKKGDEIHVEVIGKKIVLSTEKSKSFGRMELDISNYISIMQRVIHMYYKRGYDEIFIKFNQAQIFYDIQRMVQEDMVGVEIISQKENSCVLKSVAESGLDGFDVMLRRTFLHLKQITELTVEAMKQKDTDKLNMVIDMEKTNNRTTGLCRRIINKNGYGVYENTNCIYYIIEELEKIADQYKYLSKHILKTGPWPSKHAIQIYSDVAKTYCTFYELFYKFNLSKAPEIYKQRKIMVEKIKVLMSNEGYLVHPALEITQKVANMLSLKLQMEC